MSGAIPKREHSKKRHIPKRAKSKKSTFQKGHIPKRTLSKKSTFQKQHIPKRANLSDYRLAIHNEKVYIQDKFDDFYSFYFVTTSVT